ncbi:MAG: RNA polymerase sigma factor [Bacteroidetes bacterium]|nr:RNA polymerase sigma factor [Bacteroidota bacterium]
METDDELVAKTKSGDLGAFKDLVKRYEGKVAGVTRSMLGSTADAEDVGQEVFIKFYESLKKYRGEASIGTYLTRIAINLSLNEIKKRKRRWSVFSLEDEGSAIPAEENKMDLKELLLFELDRLEPDFRAVVTLRLIEGYSTEETSQILKVPLGTVLSRLARAQVKLRKGLSEHLNE